MQWATGLQLYYVIADPKEHENIIQQNTFNAKVFNSQVILPIIEGPEKSDSSYYSLNYWDRLSSYSSSCCSSSGD